MLTLAETSDPAALSRFAPDFHVCDEVLFHSTAAIELGDNLREDLLGQLRFDGYFQESGMALGVDVGRMAGLIRRLSAARLPPVFAFLFDEFWLPFRALRKWYAGLLGDYAMMPDFWAWNLDPARGDAGWKPHRDKGHISLHGDGAPKSLTTWIPLSRAVPANGCMYIVPASLDPTYGTPREREYRFSLPDVRALPAAPGDVLMWNQAVLHWGGRTAPRAPESRVSIAFEFQSRSVPPFNGPLLDPERLPTFDERLKLISRQILQYRHMYRVDPATADFAARIAG